MATSHTNLDFFFRYKQKLLNGRVCTTVELSPYGVEGSLPWEIFKSMDTLGASSVLMQIAEGLFKSPCSLFQQSNFSLMIIQYSRV